MIGYTLELLIGLLPLTFIQGTINSTIRTDKVSSLQSYSMALNVMLIFEVLAEIVILIVEII